MRRTIRLTAATFALSWASAAAAGGDGMGMGHGHGPVFLRQLFSPSSIMEHQRDIALTDAQRQAMTKEMADAQKDMLDVRWQLEEKTSALTKLLAADKIDETAALTQADQVLQVEDRLKRLRLGLLIRVKNILTPPQQEALRKLVPADRPERRWHHGDEAPGPGATEP